VVVEKSIAVGMGGQLADNVDVALRNLPKAPRLHSAVAGLGGRAITRASLHQLFRQASVQPWEGTHFLDLNERVVGREIHRTRKTRRSGPTAENILRQLAVSGRPAAE
jgi:pyruvate ferredoxin oxidoreductase alpha subunit